MSSIPALDGKAVGFVANPGAQTDFLSIPTQIQERLFHGSRGRGATMALLLLFWRYCGMGYGAYWQGLIVRRQHKELADIRRKVKRFLSVVAPSVELGGKEANHWVMPSGEELHLAHLAQLDDYLKYHGHEYPFIAMDELTSWPDLQLYFALRTLQRSDYLPPKGRPSIPKIMASTTNPWGPGHQAVKSYFIDGPDGERLKNGQPQRSRLPSGKLGGYRVAIGGTVSENRALKRAEEGVEGETYEDVLHAIPDATIRAAWAYGSWDIEMGGAFSSCFIYADPDTGTVSYPALLPSFEIPHDWMIMPALDWGFTNPYAAGFWAVATETAAIGPGGEQMRFAPGSVVCISEMWGGKEVQPGVYKGVEESSFNVAKKALRLAHRLGIEHRLQAGPADSAIFATDDRARVTTASQFQAAGLPLVKSPKGGKLRETAVQEVNAMLANTHDWSPEEGSPGPGLFLMEQRCPMLIKMFKEIPRDPRKPEDVDTKHGLDHLWDMTMYLVLYTIGRGVQYQEDAKMEALSAGIKAGMQASDAERSRLNLYRRHKKSSGGRWYR